MTLDEYLTENGETATHFALRLGFAPSTITRLRNGESRPDWDTASRIVAATGGKVTPNDFIDLKAFNSPQEAINGP